MVSDYCDGPYLIIANHVVGEANIPEEDHDAVLGKILALNNQKINWELTAANNKATRVVVIWDILHGEDCPEETSLEARIDQWRASAKPCEPKEIALTIKQNMKKATTMKVGANNKKCRCRRKKK